MNYANLAPGSYRFLVRAINADGIASAQPATISFRVLPPIWRRWWFIAIAALAILGVGHSIQRYRASRLRERRDAEDALRRSHEERLRELEDEGAKRIASDLHDDIGSSLTQISLLSEVVQQRIDANDSTLTSPLATIATSSRELVDSMSDIVWAINPQKDHLSDLVQRMRSLASEMFTMCGVNFRFRAPGGGRADVPPPGRKPAPRSFLVLQGGINNIVKHSHATSADVELRLDADRLVLKISDDGKTFDATQTDGHGLLSMSDRARGMGATFDGSSRRQGRDP